MSILWFLVGLICGVPFALGVFVIVLMIRFKEQPGVDSSNWFNPFRALWFAMTRPAEVFAGLDWIAKDESDVATLSRGPADDRGDGAPHDFPPGGAS